MLLRTSQRLFRLHSLHLILLALVLLVCHFATAVASEPFFNNDESRHTMTGVFVRDALRDVPDSFRNPKTYAETYYVRYPALGLLVWPPLFYGIEGLAMSVFGPSFAVGRALVAAFGLLMFVYTYRFARLTEEHFGGLFIAGFVGLSPVIFLLSERVMLEVPTLALGLVSIVHFEKHLRDRRTCDAVLACLFAAFCALTRFDGVFLVPYFAFRLLMTQNLSLLITRPVVYSAFAALLLTLPYYLVTYLEYGSGLSAGANDGFTAEARGAMHWQNWLFYPAALPELIGGFATVFVVAGAILALVSPRRLGPTLAWIAAVYFTFSPLAELDTRHSLYWVPALALLAWRGLVFVHQRSPWLAMVLGLFLTFGMAHDTYSQAFRYVRGYDDAAKFVVEHNVNGRPLFMDGELTGTFIYQVRFNDPERNCSVLRGDKLLYSMLSDPNSNYQQHAFTEADVLALLHEYDPEWIVVEEPQPTFHNVPGAALLRTTLKNHPEQFRRETSIPIRSNYDHFDGCSLVIYRKFTRNPKPRNGTSIRIPGLGRSLQGE